MDVPPIGGGGGGHETEMSSLVSLSRNCTEQISEIAWAENGESKGLGVGTGQFSSIQFMSSRLEVLYFEEWKKQKNNVTKADARECLKTPTTLYGSKCRISKKLYVVITMVITSVSLSRHEKFSSTMKYKL